MAMTSNLLAIGSLSHVSLLDPRVPQGVIRAVKSIDPGQVGIVPVFISSSVNCLMSIEVN